MNYRIIGADGRCYGPVPEDVVRQWIGQHRVNGHTLAEEEGTVGWKSLGTFPAFATDFAQAAPMAAPPMLRPADVSDPRASNKIPAGVCAILLGALGVHKFILGYTGAGLVMLLVTLLTCGVAAPVMAIIGLIEGIVYLTKSDAEFVRQYVEAERPWF